MKKPKVRGRTYRSLLALERAGLAGSSLDELPYAYVKRLRVTGLVQPCGQLFTITPRGSAALRQCEATRAASRVRLRVRCREHHRRYYRQRRAAHLALFVATMAKGGA